MTAIFSPCRCLNHVKSVRFFRSLFCLQMNMMRPNQLYCHSKTLKASGYKDESGLDLLNLEANSHRAHNKSFLKKKQLGVRCSDVKMLSRNKAEEFNIRGEVIFGLHPVMLALKQQKRDVYQLYISDKLEISNSNSKIVKEIICLSNQTGVKISTVSSRILEVLSAGRPHQGTCLDVSRKKFVKFDDDILIQRDQSCNSPLLWVVLDKILDPMNLGAVIRSSYFFGVDRLFTVKGSCKLSPVVSKASSGVMEIIDVYLLDNLSHFLEVYSSSGWNVIATVSKTDKRYTSNEAISLDRITVDRNTVVLFGNEGKGLDSTTLDLCNQYVYISPHSDDVIDNLESLNVSVSAGVMLHSLTRPRKGQL